MPPFPAWLYSLYYPWASFLNRLLPWTRAGGMRLKVAPSVYKPIQNEERVVAWVPQGRDVLDVGCGSGVLSVAAAARSRRVLAVDLNPAAVRCTRENAARLGHSNIEVREGDAFEHQEAVEFGVVLCAPPFGEADVPGRERRWASAPGFLEALFERAPGWLAPEGRLILHHRVEAQARLESLGKVHGLVLRSVHPNHRKSLRLRALGWLYMQMGIRTSFYVFERRGQP